jgi:RHS repeat-associated protein
LPWQITVKTDDGLSQKGTITYIYDATGNKLKKVVEDKSTTGKTITTITSYIGGLIYESKTTSPANTPNDDYTDKLQLINHEEGRVRYIAAKDGIPAHFEYDYFVKDHLGNVRAVLTEQKDNHNYMATMERGAGNVVRVQENQLFNNLDASEVTAQSVGYPSGNSATDPNEWVARVNGSTQKKGPGIVLKVMAGDVVDLGIKAFYHSQSGIYTTGDALTDILSSLAGGIVSASGVTKGTLAELSDPNNSPLLGALTTFRQNKNQDIANKPKAYLNWILVDEQFKYVSTVPQSNAMPAGDPDQINTLVYNGIDITKNGYLYIYVSNETENWDVFFDDLAITHHRGPMLEETHYYPFGLTMAGISSKALNFGAPENKHKFNGIEQNNDFDLNMYDAFYRNLDPQLGRFWQIDPKPTVMTSPYAAMKNNPILLSDPLGDTTWAYNQNGVLLGVIPDKLKNQVHFLKTEGDPGQQVNTKGLSKKELNALGKSFRQNSFAFIGNKTVSEMQKLAQKAESLGPGAFGMMGKELTFVGTVGPDKQIHLTALAIDDRNKQNNDAGEAKINEAYPDAQSQSNLVLWGHIHPTHGDTSPDPQGAFGTPSPGADYGNFLYRNGANQKGPSPAIIGTVYGITVYGSKEDYSNNSYILYKSLK